MPSDRLHALDLVRGAALMLGIVFHAGLSFYPSAEPSWIVMDVQRSEGIAWTGFILHIFRMTTFFLLAGYFGRMVYHRRGALWFIKSRTKRVALPLIIFWPGIFVGITALLIWGLVRQYGVAPGDMPPPPPMTADTFPWTHLWFLYVLIWFYVIMLIVRLPIALIDTHGELRKAFDALLSSIMRTPLLPLVLALPAALALLAHQDWVHWWGVPTPDYGVIPNTAALVCYGLAFTIGWIFQRNDNALPAVQRHWPTFFISGAGAAAICLYLLGGQPSTTSVLNGQEELVFAGAYTLAMWNLTFAFIGIALTFFASENRVTRYLADSSYWLYLIHLPLILALQIWVFDWNWPALAKFGFILGVSMPLMLLSYQLLIRHSFMGNLLNGPRKTKNDA